MSKPSIPVLVGVGQVTSRWDGDAGPLGAPSPLGLCVEASRRALADAGITPDAIDTLAVARLTGDSIPNPRHPFGQNTNLPGTIARDLGLHPRHAIYEIAGGQSSQKLLNEMAARIHDGETSCALVTGSEATKAIKAAQRAGITLDWSDSSDMAFEDRGMGPMLLNRTEIKHGLVLPAYFYALLENILAAQAGETRSQHRAAMSALCAKFAAVAATNPHAQFDTKGFDADFLATPSRENYPFADPFLKWHMAQDAVNQGAAVVIMSDAKADALGIDPARRVYLHGGGEAIDDHISLRPQLDHSWAMRTAISRALDQVGYTPSQIDAFDLYSCFPCAVFASMAALGIDHHTETRPLTVTGGLPFFGGPGNNYSLHAIASMADHLRARPGAIGLVLANGGWMTKEAVGIWSTARPAGFVPVAPYASPRAQVALDEAPTAGTLETFTVTHGKDGPDKGIIFARSPDQKRFLAFASPRALARLLAEESPIGLPVTATSQGEVNTFDFV